MPGTNPGTTGLVSWWSLNETSGQRNDSHGTNHLADNNTVLSAAGMVGNAADFEKDNLELLNIVDNASLRLGDIAATMGIWVKPESTNQSMQLMGKYRVAVGAREYLLFFASSLTKFQFGVSPDGTNITVVTHPTVVSAGNWYFVVGWHDPDANIIGIEVNGVSPTTQAHTTGIYTSSGEPFEIGSLGGLANNYLDGLGDEPFLAKRLYTADERTWLYNAGAGRAYSELIGGERGVMRGVLRGVLRGV